MTDDHNREYSDQSDEMELFRQESMQAIGGVKRQFKRERRVVAATQWAAVAVIAILGVIIVPRFYQGTTSDRGGTFTAAGSSSRLHFQGNRIAQLVIPEPGDTWGEIFRNGEELQLDPIIDLQVGDSITVNADENVIVYDSLSDTRTRISGPADFTVSEDSVGLLSSQSESLETWARSLPELSPSTCRAGESSDITNAFPSDTSVPPGALVLRWEYHGDSPDLEITILNADGETLNSVQLTSTAGEYAIDLSEGGIYYWTIAIPDGAELAVNEFRILPETQWEWVSHAIETAGLSGENAEQGIAGISDVYELSALYDIFDYYGLHREANAARSRLHTLIEDEG